MTFLILLLLFGLSFGERSGECQNSSKNPDLIACEERILIDFSKVSVGSKVNLKRLFTPKFSLVVCSIVSRMISCAQRTAPVCIKSRDEFLFIKTDSCDMNLVIAILSMIIIN